MKEKSQIYQKQVQFKTNKNYLLIRIAENLKTYVQNIKESKESNKIMRSKSNYKK